MRSGGGDFVRRRRGWGWQRITGAAGEIVALHAVLALDMSGDWLDGRPSPQFARGITTVTPCFWPSNSAILREDYANGCCTCGAWAKIMCGLSCFALRGNKVVESRGHLFRCSGSNWRYCTYVTSAERWRAAADVGECSDDPGGETAGPYYDAQYADGQRVERRADANGGARA